MVGVFCFILITIKYIMIKSMTGYGHASVETDQCRYTVEIKSLNSKFFDISLKLPGCLSDKEFFIRNELSKLFERGKVTASVFREDLLEKENLVRINIDVFKSYYQQLKNLTIELNDTSSNLVSAVLQLPSVVDKRSDVVVDESEWGILWDVFQNAVNEFQLFRMQEGGVLCKDLALRVGNILQFLLEIEVHEHTRISAVRERIMKLLEDQLPSDVIDRNRFEQEMIYHLEKLDITEEKVRLRNHCDYFLLTMNENQVNGKKLGFVAQEIGREINTLGSKANDARIQHLVVNMKDELEKLKEQLLNIL